MDETIKCFLCGKELLKHITLYSIDNKTYCSRVCTLYDKYPTKEEFLKAKEAGNA